MSEQRSEVRVVPTQRESLGAMRRVRWPLWCLVLGLVAGAWIGGGPDRYGEEEGIVGGFRGAGRTMARCFGYSSATLRDWLTFDRASVRKMGLTQQVETRLWQDKRLVAGEIIVEVEDGGSVMLRGIVPDQDHKDRAVTLARDTRGVERVIDELAIRPSSRTIKTAPAAPVPTGVASNAREVR